MAKQAKISLVADVSGFRKSIDQAKSAIEGIGKAKISTEAAKKLDGIFSSKLKAQASEIEKRLGDVNKSLEKMAKNSRGAIDESRMARTIKYQESLNKSLRENLALQKQMDSGGAEGAVEAKSKSSGVMGKIGRRVGGVLAGVGLMSMFSRREKMADERLRISSLTKGGGLPSEVSALGFSTEERRNRAADLAQAAGSVDAKKLNTLTNMGEQAQRAYGVSEEQSTGFVESLHKAGVSDQAKAMSNAIGAAVAAGLEGSKIGSYLQSMSGYMDNMSQGINVDSASLNGFAAAMGKMPFFKEDPSRIFKALSSIDAAFKGGDAFQRGQATRGILKGAGGAAPNATEFRRSMGLFGEIDSDTMAGLKKGGMGEEDLKALRMKGEDIIGNMMDEVMEQTRGESESTRMSTFGTRLGITDAGAAASLYNQNRQAEMKGTTIGRSGLTDRYKKATMSPEERLAESYKGGEKAMKDLTSTLSQVMDRMATNLGGGMVSLGAAIDGLTEAITGKKKKTDVAGDVASIGAAGTALGMIAGASVAAPATAMAGIGYGSYQMGKNQKEWEGKNPDWVKKHPRDAMGNYNQMVPSDGIPSGGSSSNSWMSPSATSSTVPDYLSKSNDGLDENTIATREQTAAMNGFIQVITSQKGMGAIGNRVPSNTTVLDGSRQGK